MTGRAPTIIVRQLFACNLMNATNIYRTPKATGQSPRDDPMKRERTLLLLGLGLAAAGPAAASIARDVPDPIQRLARIRADYLKALTDRNLRDPSSETAVAQYWPNFPNFPNFNNWANGWRNY